MALESYLKELAEPSKPISASGLARLSNLDPAEFAALGESWTTIPLERRRQMVRQLVGLAEESYDLDFEPVFRLALADPDAAVRLVALEGLWESEDASLVSPIIDLLQNDPTEEVRAAAAQALGKFILLVESDKLHARAAARLETALLGTLDTPDTPLLIRRRTLEAVAPLGHPSIPARIEAAYHSMASEEQISAIFAMGRSCDPRWLPALIEELQHDDPARRFEAAAACGHLEDRRAVPALRRALSDEDRDVQLATIAALGHIGGAEARQILTTLVRQADEQLQEAAQEALEETEVGENPFSISAN